MHIQDFHFELARLHQIELLEMAEQRRMLKAAKKGQNPMFHLLNRLYATLGDAPIRSGLKLRAQTETGYTNAKPTIVGYAPRGGLLSNSWLARG